ncbi:glutathionylspermidine synthase, partial [Campylobacter jejuni]
MQLLQVDKLQKDYLENIGFSWHTDEDGSDYISNKLVCVKES